MNSYYPRLSLFLVHVLMHTPSSPQVHLLYIYTRLSYNVSAFSSVYLVFLVLEQLLHHNTSSVLGLCQLPSLEIKPGVHFCDNLVKVRFVIRCNIPSPDKEIDQHCMERSTYATDRKSFNSHTAQLVLNSPCFIFATTTSSGNS